MGLSRGERAKRRIAKKMERRELNTATDAFVAELKKTYTTWAPSPNDRQKIRDTIRWIVRWYTPAALKASLDAALAVAFFTPAKARAEAWASPIQLPGFRTAVVPSGYKEVDISIRAPDIDATMNAARLTATAIGLNPVLAHADDESKGG